MRLIDGLKYRFDAWVDNARMKASIVKAQSIAMEQESKLLEASWSRYVDPEPDENEWVALGRSRNYRMNWELSTNDETYLDALRSRARHLAQHEGIAKSILRNYVKFTWKTGATIQPNDDNPQHAQAWQAFEESQHFDLFFSDVIYQAHRDGEVFIQDQGAYASPRFRLLPPECFRKPERNDKATFGIETMPDDVSKPVWYYYTTNGTTTPIPASQILHIKLNVDSNVKRGRTSLEPVMQDILDYRKFRQNRARLNAIRTWLGIVQTVKGSPSRVSALNTLNKSLSAGSGNYSTDLQNRAYAKDPAGPLWYTTNNPSEFELLAPNVQAADAQHDGRMIQLCVAAGTGQSETWVTADAQNANYASQAVAESPAVVEMQCWQKFFEPTVKEIYRRVIQAGIDGGTIKATYQQTIMVNGEETTEEREADLSCTVVWPELIHREIKAEAEAYQIMLTNKVASRRTVAGKFDLDYDREIENRNKDGEKEDEEKDRLAKQNNPFMQPFQPKQDQAKDQEEEAYKNHVTGRVLESLKRIGELVRGLNQ